MVKKGAGISLCAVLVGGLAAGAFEGVNALTGWNHTNVSAAAQDDQITLTKTKVERTTDKEEDAEDDTDNAAKGTLDVSDIVEEAMPSVVSITTKSLQEVQTYFGYGQFGNGYAYAPQQEQEVDQYEGCTAVFPCDVGEFPNIAQTDGAAGAEQNEAKAAS